MQCPFPMHLRVRNSYSGVIEAVDVPCGKCDVCKRNKLSDWLFRLQFDVDASVNSFFVTLTYNDDNLPDKVKLNDVQKFFKRLRKKCEPKKVGDIPNKRYVALKYFLTSEYGSLRNRPHYHAIVLNVIPLSGTPQEAIEAAWPHGFVYIGTVTSSSCRYVLKYIQKDADLPANLYQSLFYVMSKGIGKTFLTISNEHNSNNIRDRLCLAVDINGYCRQLPRYYQEKIFGGERRLVSDNARTAFLSSHGIDPTQPEQYQEYKHEKRQDALSFISQLQRRERLGKLGIRNAGKL